MISTDECQKGFQAVTVEKLVAFQNLPLKGWRCSEGGPILSAREEVSQTEENFERYIYS